MAVKAHRQEKGHRSQCGFFALQIKDAKSKTARFSRREIGLGYRNAIFSARTLSVRGRLLLLLRPKNLEKRRITLVSMGTVGSSKA